MERRPRRCGAKALRAQQLGARYCHSRGGPVVDASRDKLVCTDVPHHMPALGAPPLKRVWPAPRAQFVAAGQPQASELPTYKQLNMSQPGYIRLSTLSREQHVSYATLKGFDEPIWPR